MHRLATNAQVGHSRLGRAGVATVPISASAAADGRGAFAYIARDLIPACRFSRTPAARYNPTMSVFEDHRDELERYEFMMGMPRGRLAVALDLLTDALAFVGQHGVYCQSARQPGKPAMDVQIIMQNIAQSKELLQSVMEELRRQSAAAENK